jgi:hypothetical protein
VTFIFEVASDIRSEYLKLLGSEAYIRKVMHLFGISVKN